jgi:protein transport protein SEC13
MSKVVDTGHASAIQDTQLDYYGTRLATCALDGVIKVFNINPDLSTALQASFNAHEGPALSISWAHPMFGALLATGGSDRKVNIWKEMAVGSWALVYEHLNHEAPIVKVSWAPSEEGLKLAAVSADGCVSLISRLAEDSWGCVKFSAHNGGVSALTWEPASILSFLTDEPRVTQKMFATGGADGSIKVWRSEGEEYKAEELKGHKSYVRSLVWIESSTPFRHKLASCSDDGSAYIWTKNDASEPWSFKELPKYTDKPSHLAASNAGNLLTVSYMDGKHRVLGSKGENWEVVEEYGNEVSED